MCANGSKVKLFNKFWAKKVKLTFLFLVLTQNSCALKWYLYILDFLGWKVGWGGDNHRGKRVSFINAKLFWIPFFSSTISPLN